MCKSNTHFDASGVDVRDIIHESVATPSWNIDETNVIDVMNSQYPSAVKNDIVTFILINL